MKKAMNKSTNVEYKSLISVTKFSVAQMHVIDAFKQYCDVLAAKKDTSEEDKTRYEAHLITRKEAYLFNVELFKKKSAPYFVTKNKALVTKDSLRDLNRASVSATAAKEASEVVSDEKTLTKKTKTAKKKAATKKAATATKRDKKSKKEDTKQVAEVATNEDANEALALLSA